MFKVECPGCNAPYQVDERRVPSSGLKMRCPKCGASFQVAPPPDARSTGPSPVLGAALGGGGIKKATMIGVAPQPPRPGAARPPPAPARSGPALGLSAAGGEDPYGEVDLPTVGTRGPPRPGRPEADLPAAAPARPRPPPPPVQEFGDLDLGPLDASPAEPGGAELDLPAPAPPRASGGGGFGELDLPAPRGTAPHADEIDLPVVGGRGTLDLPAPHQRAELPAARGTGAAFGEVDLPLPGAGADLPSPTESAALPSPAASLPQASADLPIPAAGLPVAGAAAGLPSLGGGLPSPAAGLPTAATSGLPTAAAGGLPSPSAAGLPTASGAGLPEHHDSFGELELPLGGSVPPSGPPASGGVVRQAGGGTSFGEVNLDGGGDGPSIGADDDMEFGAIPQERAGRPVAEPVAAPPPIATAPLPPSVPSLAGLPPLEPPKKRRALRVVLGLVTVTALAGGTLALVPDVGPFGVYWITDQLKRGDYQRLTADTAKQARGLLAADTHPKAKRAQEIVETARGQARRVKALAAYAAYVAFLRELRFGADPAARARGQVLLDELKDAEQVEHLELARAAQAAATGQLARARQLLAKSGKDVDALALRGELELRSREPKAALEAWTAAEGSEKSARSAFGLARAQHALGQMEEARKLAGQALERNPDHVGARILLAETSWESSRKEKDAVKLLDEVVEQAGKASPDELVAAHTLLGDIHLARSRITHAENAYGEALKVSPKAARALGGLGDSLFRAGRYSEALARFEAAVQADPDAIDAKVGVARTMLALERVQDARDALKKLKDAHPKSMDVAYWYGKASEAQGNRKDAEEAYRAAIQNGAKDPDVVQAYVALALLLNQLGRNEEAQKALAEARQKLADSPAIHKALGELALTQGRYEEALAEFDKALALDPDDVGATFKRGVSLRKNRSFDEAQKAFDQVAAVDRDYPGLALERGMLYEASGRGEEALKAYEGALAKAPSDPDLMLRVGCGKVGAGRAKEATQLLRKVLEKRPTSAETLHCLGRALLVEGTNLADALKTLERAVELDPHRAEYWLYVGWAANEAGRVARAQTALEKALELDRGLADAYWQRGVLRQRQGAVKDAVVDLKKALELRPSRHEAHAALAQSYYDLRMEAEAMAEWQQAITAMPDNATWRFRYGKLLAENRRTGEARDQLQKAVDLALQMDPKPDWLAQAHLALARVMGNTQEAAKHWKAFLESGPRDSAYRPEAKRALEQLGQPWTGD